MKHNIQVYNHEVMFTCLKCHEEFDGRIHRFTCPYCQTEIPHANRISKTIDYLILAIAIWAVLSMVTGCSVSKMQYSVRQHKNRIAQENAQYEHSISAGNDWTRPYRHGWERPKGSWPFQFLQ